MFIIATLTETGASWSLMASQPRLLVNSRPAIFSLRDGILGWNSAVVQGREAMVWGGTLNYFQVPKMASKDDR